MKSETMISSKEVAKAKSRPDSIPGAISGSVTVRNVVSGPAPKAGGSRFEPPVEDFKTGGDGDQDEG